MAKSVSSATSVAKKAANATKSSQKSKEPEKPAKEKSKKGATKVIQKVVDEEKKKKKNVKKAIVTLKADMFKVNQARQDPNAVSKGLMEVLDNFVFDMLDGFIEASEDLADHQHRDLVNERDLQAAVKFSFAKDLLPHLLNKAAFGVVNYTA